MSGWDFNSSVVDNERICFEKLAKQHALSIYRVTCIFLQLSLRPTISHSSQFHHSSITFIRQTKLSTMEGGKGGKSLALMQQRLLGSRQEEAAIANNPLQAQQGVPVQGHAQAQAQAQVQLPTANTNVNPNPGTGGMPGMNANAPMGMTTMTMTPNPIQFQPSMVTQHPVPISVPAPVVGIPVQQQQQHQLVFVQQVILIKHNKHLK